MDKRKKKNEKLTDFEKCFQGMCCDANKKFAKECSAVLFELAKKQIMEEQNIV